MPQIKVQDFNTGKIFSIDYEDDDTIGKLKTILELLGYEPGMELYYDDNISSGNVLQDVVHISTLNEPGKPLVVVGDTKSAPASAPEPEPETVPTTKEDEVTRLLSEIQKLQEKLKHMEDTRDMLLSERKIVDDINMDIGLIQSQITQLLEQADSMFKGGGKRRRRGRRKPTKSRKTKQTRKRRSLKRQSLKRRSLKRRSLKRRSLKRRSRK